MGSYTQRMGVFRQCPTNSHRINIRANDETLRQLDEMVAATGASVSEIVRASLSAEYARFKAKSALSKRSAIVANAGKHRSIGEGAGSLSTNYKKLLAGMQVGIAATRSNSRG